MPPKGSALIAREIRMMKASQEAILSRIVALEMNQRRGKATLEESDREEEGESERPQGGVQGDDELDPDERRMVKMLKVVKSDAHGVKMEFPMYNWKLNVE